MPTTASTSSATMATGRFPPRSGSTRSAPAWVRVTARHICDGPHPRVDRLLIRPAWWARPVPAPRWTGQGQDTAATGQITDGVTPRTPAPTLHQQRLGADPDTHRSRGFPEHRAPGLLPGARPGAAG